MNAKRPAGSRAFQTFAKVRPRRDSPNGSTGVHQQSSRHESLEKAAPPVTTQSRRP
jgi:hypothetical protein